MEDNEEGKTFVESMGFTLDAFRSGMFYTGGHYTGELYYSLLDLNITAQAWTKKEKERTIKALKYLIPHWEIQKTYRQRPVGMGAKTLLLGI